ncbi:hypothetical protein [Oceanobacillus manasiensis]|uniref:hypothetical protein n=1 Tax=Oceanobacillus manasiensis TaxID=586413 RepID=UPI000AACBE44|nr:hypothetical protein [Oceanobacillus manasiensis]
MEQLFEEQIELPFIQSVSMTDGMKSVMVDEVYYVEFEKEFLDDVSKDLQHGTKSGLANY